MDEDLSFSKNLCEGRMSTLRQSEKIKLCFIEISSKLDVSCEIGIVQDLVLVQKMRFEHKLLNLQPSNFKRPKIQQSNEANEKK